MTGITYRGTTSRNNSDGGYDLKSRGTVLDRTVALGNGRNYRFWGTGKGSGLVSRNTRGADIWFTNGSDWTIDGITFERTDGAMSQVLAGEGSGTLTLRHCIFKGFAPNVSLFKGRGTLKLDESCKPDAQGHVVNTPPPGRATLRRSGSHSWPTARRADG